MVKVKSQTHNVRRKRVVVVAQMIEQSFPTPEISGSNPVIGNVFLLSTTTILLDGNKEKQATENGPIYWDRSR